MVSGAAFILAAFVLYISDTFLCRLRLFLRLSLLTLPTASTSLQTWNHPSIIRLILTRKTHSNIRLRIGAGTSGLPYATTRHTARLGVHAAAPRPVPLQVTEFITIRLSSAVKVFPHLPTRPVLSQSSAHRRLLCCLDYGSCSIGELYFSLVLVD